jgi:hypothetical protein
MYKQPVPVCLSSHAAHFFLSNGTQTIRVESTGNNFKFAFQALGYPAMNATYALCKYSDLTTKSCMNVTTSGVTHENIFAPFFEFEDCGKNVNILLEFYSFQFLLVVVMLCIATEDVYEAKCSPLTKDATFGGNDKPMVQNIKKRDVVYVSESVDDCSLSLKRATDESLPIDFVGAYLDKNTAFVFESEDFNITIGDTFKFCAQTWQNRNISIVYTTCTTIDATNTTVCSNSVAVKKDYINGSLIVDPTSDRQKFNVTVTGVSGMYVAAVGRSPFIDQICP